LLALAAALLAIAAGAALGLGTALAQTADQSSPAQGHASVVAQGVTTMPTGDIAWRVTRATTPPQGDRTRRDGPGFIVTETGTLLLNDVSGGRQTRLSATEATFVPAGAPPEEIPLGDAPLAYDRIDLVPVSAVNDPGSDAMVFVGQPFVSPGGNRDLDLVRDVLAADETVTLPLATNAAPVLFLVTAGEVELAPAEDATAAPVPLAAGQAAALGGAVTVRASDPGGASYVTAVVGPEVPAILAQAASPTPTPAPAPASLTVLATVCPAAYEGTNYAADCVEPVADITLTLSNAATGFSLDATTAADGSLAFTDLAAGAYDLTGGVPGEFATQVVSCVDESGSTVNAQSQSETPGTTITLAAGSAVTCSWYVVPEDLRGASEGTIAVTVHLCPGTPIDPYADCAQGDASGAVIAGPVTLTADSATVQGPSWFWGVDGGVPFGTYVLQPGGITVPAGYELSEVRGASGASGDGWTLAIDEANPEAILDVIYVPTGAPRTNAALDGDGDRLPDTQEATLGTNPANPDTDQDGLFDGAEIAAGTDPLRADTDGDGFGDNDEILNGFDPSNAASVPSGQPATDSDGDLLTDAQEAELGTDPAAADSDGDGLTDAREVGVEPGAAIGTDPTRFDTDGDGVGDGAEVANATDPLDPTSA
jgi:hypothetical protein